MKRFLSILCLLTSFVVSTQAQKLEIGRGPRRPLLDGVINLHLDPATGIMMQTPKVGPSVPIPVDTNQINGWAQTQQRLRQAIASNVASGTGNVSPSTVKPVTDGLYPTLGRDAKQYGVTAGSSGDQSSAFAQAFATQSEVILPPGEYRGSKIIVPAGKTLELGMGATIKGLSLSPGDHSGLIEVQPGGRIRGFGVVDGNASGRPGLKAHGVYFINADSVQVSGITVRNCGGSGIRYQNSHAAVVNNVQVLNCGGVGVENIVSDYARITGALIVNCDMGVQWWGTPAFNDFSDGFTITGCVAKNIRNGAFWGFCGRSGTVTGNTAEECGDVLFDAEYCFDMTFNGNTGKNGRNAGLAWFHGSKRITFTGNTITQDVGYGPAAKGYGPDLSEDIKIIGGTLETKDPASSGVYSDFGYTRGLRLIGVTIKSGGYGVEGQLIDDFEVTACTIDAKGLIGVQNTGGNRGRIENNTITYLGTNAAAAKAIWIPWVDVNHQSQYNSIKNNVAPSFGLGVHNDAWGNANGFNKIIDNTVTMVTTPGGAGDLSIIRGNRNAAGVLIDGTAELTGTDKTKLTNTSGTNSGDQTLTLNGQKLILSGPNSSTVTLPISGTGTGTGTTYAGSALIIVDFNSLGAGRGSSHEISNPDDYSPGPFPYTMMNTLAAQFPSATFAKKNFSVSGRQTPTMIANSTQVDALFAPATYDRQIIVSGEITNHIADGGATAQQAIDSYVSYCKSRRAKGFLIVATTVFPRTSFFGSGMSAAEFESRRTVVNDYIKSRYLEFADVLADVNTISGLTYPDGTHLDDAGYVKMGNFIASKVAPLLVTGFNPQSIAFLLSGTTTTPPSSTTTTPTTGTVTAGTVLMIAGTGSDGSTNITDATGKTVSRVGNPVISTAQSQYGGSSIYLDGSSFLTVATSTDFDFGTGDFTVELFARPTEIVRQYGGLVSRGDETDNQWTFSYNNTSLNPDLFIRQNGGYGSGAIAGSSSGLTLNAWQHVALVRKSNVVKVYVNGNAVGSASTTLSMETTGGNRRINIGAFPTPNTAGSPEQEKFKGYVQGIRITKGQSRYDGNFTPPASY